MAFSVDRELVPNREITPAYLLGGEEQITRGRLFEKLESAQLSKRYYGQRSEKLKNGIGLGMGACLVGVVSAVAFTILLAGITNGFGPSPDPTFYPALCSTFYGISLTIGMIGLIVVIVAAVKRRKYLNEMLTKDVVKDLLDEMRTAITAESDEFNTRFQYFKNTENRFEELLKKLPTESSSNSDS